MLECPRVAPLCTSPTPVCYPATFRTPTSSNSCGRATQPDAAQQEPATAYRVVWSVTHDRSCGSSVRFLVQQSRHPLDHPGVAVEGRLQRGVALLQAVAFGVRRE